MHGLGLSTGNHHGEQLGTCLTVLTGFERLILVREDLGQNYHFMSDGVSVKSFSLFGTSRYLAASLLCKLIHGYGFEMSSDTTVS